MEKIHKTIFGAAKEAYNLLTGCPSPVDNYEEWKRDVILKLIQGIREEEKREADLLDMRNILSIVNIAQEALKGE